jgi:hypothetical protein
MSSAPVKHAARRSQGRTKVNEETVLSLHESATHEIPCELIDDSSNGFCIRLAQTDGFLERLSKLNPDVQVTYPWGSVNARLIWTRQIGNSLTLGFHLPISVGLLDCPVRICEQPRRVEIGSESA